MKHAALLDENETLKKKVNTLDEENRLLREQLRFLKAQQFGPKTEKMSKLLGMQGQAALFELEEVDDTSEKEKDDERETVTFKRRKSPGPKKLPDWFPREVIDHDLTDEEKVCGDCGLNMETIGKDVTEELEYVPAQVKVLEHHHHKYACARCSEAGDLEKATAIKSAEKPARLIPGSMAASGLLAHVMIAKFADGLPFYRVEKQMTRLGISLKRATMCNWAKKIGGCLKDQWDLLLEDAKTHNWLQMDETTVQVMNEPDKDNQTKSFMWVIRGGPPDKVIILFRYDPSRAGSVAGKLLEGYQGIVQTDGYAGYSHLAKLQGVTHAGDMDHVRRKFADVCKAAGKNRKKKGFADQALERINKLYAIERRLKRDKADVQEVVTTRQDEARPILDQLKPWLEELAAKVPPSGLLGKAINYTLKQWPKLLVYLDHGHVPLSTALVENAIRPYVIGRKAWLFSGSPAGAQASAIIYSFIETARANGWEPHAYLRWLFERLPAAQTVEEKRALLPTVAPPFKGEPE